MPSAGWPLVVFAHGTGGSFRDHATDAVAGALSSGDVKFAVLGIDQVEHGPRRGSSEESPDNLFFNFLNPKAARGNPIQGAADQLSLAAFAATLDGSGDNPTTIDATKLFFFGHSQGSTEGSLMLPYGDAYKAALFSGNGASLINALLTKSKPVDIKSLLPIALSDLSVTGDIGEYHPVLTLLQQWIDPADPLNFARYVATEPLEGHTAKHLFQTYGTGDSYAPPVTLAIYARAGALALVKPVLEDTGKSPLSTPLDLVDAPLSGNLANGTLTQGMREYKKVTDGHFVVFEEPTANADMVRFFSQAVSGVPAIGD
jgi:pimeloyl-ACP methyl ester carboxylesterase